VSDDDFLRVEASDCPMSSCAAPAWSPCRTGKGKVAAQYHTARFRLVPHLAKALSVPVPPVRKPGSTWTELPRPAAAGPARCRRGTYGLGTPAPPPSARRARVQETGRRSGAHGSIVTGTPSGVTRVFAEKISTRAATRPELDRAVALARELRASGVAVTIVVHEHKRLGRGIELAALAEQLKAAGIGLEFLTGELQGSHDPSGVVFTVLAALSGMEREYIRDRTLEGHESARTRGKAIGGAAVTDDAMLAVALHLRGQELSLRDIAARLVIATGKKKGQHPSPATVLRMLREHDEQTAT
jgi:DNA invertase Pin-like site-specific DNA recombinase